jgi:hypothetical protein
MCRNNNCCCSNGLETSQLQMLELVGTTLYGFCGGKFGRDSYGSKDIEAVGKDWIVVREDGEPNFATFDSFDKLRAFVKEYSSDPNES